MITIKYQLIYWILFPVHLLVALIAVLLSPVLPLFASDDGWLPNWLWWFQTPDASLDGDSGWRSISEHPTVNKLPRYFRQVLWLLRNPSYGFDWTVMASKPLPATYTLHGDPACDKKLRKTTWVYVVCGGYWHFRIYIKYPRINRCFQLNLGWNLHPLCVSGKQEGQRAKYRFTPHPFRSCSG